ncbi:DUF4190 domain-containing protein [Enemella evansiae]|uniref:DUF4190 domain-containing protein n=1 Tax=Enemella evansiae TaxID=2016499 RepID=UPI0011803347|nr:DUF4190 domain-containing protein [Enemella evansiae]
MTVGPNPFSREGSRPGDGLGEVNRFETLADGATPQASGVPATEPPQAQTQPQAQPQPQGQWSEAGGPPDLAYAEPAGEAFPSYPYGEPQPPVLQPHPPQPYPVGQPPVQPYPGASYPAPYNPYQGYGRVLSTSPYATVSLVTGIIGFFCGITGPLAIGFAVAALRQISREPQVYGGRGQAIGGLITGIFGSLWLVYYLVLALAS